MENKIVYLGVDHIHPHPKNPRKDLGDLSELAASIRMNGVLQNLTVIPAPELGEGEFTAIIGHRRHAAAKIAGLTEVPCVITKLDEAEQVQIMVCENVQRSDLSPYEQAEGFQMMLDLGGSIEDVASKSGFSVQTIKNRTKLLALDKKEFLEAEKRGVSLFQFAEIAALKDAAQRDRVLKSAGTKNFQRDLLAAQEAEQRAEVRAENRKLIESFAEPIGERNRDAMKRVTSIGYSTAPEKTKTAIPADALLLGGSIPYYYRDDGIYCYDIYRERTPEDAAENEAIARAAQERQARANALEEEAKAISNRVKTLRTNFIRSVSETRAKKALNAVVPELIQHLPELRTNWGRPRELLEAIQNYLNLPEEEDDPIVAAAEFAESAPAQGLLFLTATVLESDGDYIKKQWTTQWEYVYKPNDKMDALYSVLKKLGYEMSDEETQLQNGDHPFLKTEEAEAST